MDTRARPPWWCSRRSTIIRSRSTRRPRRRQPAIADQVGTSFDSARDSFKAGDYAKALELTDQAIRQMPNDAALHEFRGVVLFALHRYEDAAAPLYAVLSVGPGWDWSTLVGLYPNVSVYTDQLRALESYCKHQPGVCLGPVRARLLLPDAREYRRGRSAVEAGRRAPAQRHHLGAVDPAARDAQRAGWSFRGSQPVTCRGPGARVGANRP